jgi:DNA end-binding protein Ku
MPRPLWTGSLSFGLVNVPVRLVSATRDLDLHFRQLHKKDHTPVETRRVCSEEEKEVPYEAIGREYEGVILTDEELSAADPRKTRTIDIEAFVELDEIDPIYYDHPYYLVPAGETDGTVRAYRLLAEVMGKTDRAALGRFVMRTKEYLVAIRVRDKALTLSTMRFHDEVRSTDGIDGASGRAKPKEVERAMGLIDALTVPWDPANYQDEYRKRLQAIVRRKRKGGEIKAPELDPQRTQPVPDLMAALEKSMAKVKGEGGGLEDLSKDELYEKATDAEVPGRSKMSKDELVEALGGG